MEDSGFTAKDKNGVELKVYDFVKGAANCFEKIGE
jgi:hypothetical protein